MEKFIAAKWIYEKVDTNGVSLGHDFVYAKDLYEALEFTLKRREGMDYSVRGLRRAKPPELTEVTDVDFEFEE